MPSQVSFDDQVSVAGKYGLAKLRSKFAAETEPFQTVLDLEAEHQARCAFTEDHKEAVAAFVEKRRPVFKGR